jgi:sarcosine oxidase
MAKLKRRSFLHLSGASAIGAGIGQTRSTASANQAEVIVIGAGAFGGWTAFYLRQRGARVTLIDAYGPGNSRSSSGGETRLLRADYGADELYTRLALKAFPLWKKWQEEWKSRLLLPSGRLLMARPEGMEDLRARQTRLAKHNFRTELIDHDELRYRWPQINLEDIAGGIFDTTSGILMARQSCRVVAEEFERAGGRMVIGRARPGRIVNGEMESLELESGERLSAPLYVFACGPWLRKIFPQLLGKRLRTPRRDVFFVGTPAGDDRFSWRRMPSWGFGGPSAVNGFSNWYGFPNVDDRGVKACPVDETNQIDPDTDERLVSAYQIKRAHDYLGWRFPALRNEPITETRVCQTENTIDDNFIATPHPEMRNVWIAGGGSGHGFKHGPAFGEYLSNRLLGRGGDPDFDAAFRLREETF